ncbi:hypothetical protein HZH68_012205 [Vespula germanica]|uniref:Uncharacterized protein n=1 Tax=Vespula germanica TaxID=30212 RepID=A0A834MZ32_VESGE|nr:hypothetical protein HZH68_012205 [Vespula germanica]
MRWILPTRAFQPGSRAHLRICLGKLDSRLTCSLVASPLSLDSSPYFVPSASPHHFTPSTPTTSPAASSPGRPLNRPPTTPLTIPYRRSFSFRQPRVPAEALDISGYVYLYKGSKTSDGDGGKVDRRGIETYLLVQLASVQLPLHPYPVGELRPSPTSTNFHLDTSHVLTNNNRGSPQLIVSNAKGQIRHSTLVVGSQTLTLDDGDAQRL